MRKITSLLTLLLLSVAGAWATDVTTVATAGSYLTLDQLKALSGTGAHVAFANLGSNPWMNKWLAYPQGDANLTLSTLQLYTITDGTVSGKFFMQRVSDNQYRTGSGWGALDSAENIEFRVYTGGTPSVACSNPISIHNNNGTQWNQNANSFGGMLNGWAAYAAYGPFYILEVNCFDDDASTTIQTSTQIVTDGHTMEIPSFPGKKLVDGSPTSIEINGADAVYNLHYIASTFDYNVAITGNVPAGTNVTIKGDAVSNGASVSYADEVVASDVSVTFPSGYDYMAYKVTIAGTTVTIECYDTRWPINFDRSQTFTRSDRHINSVSFNGQTVGGLYENTSTTCYQDLTASKAVVLPTGISIKPSFNMTGIWQHGFVYVDLNNDGDFTDEGELVSKINEGNPNLSTAIHAFVLNAASGTYRMRIKTDWASEDPGGNTGEDPNDVNSNNHIIKNGGMIVDMTLRLVSPMLRLKLSAQKVSSQPYLLGERSTSAERLAYSTDANNAKSIWYYDGTNLCNYSGGYAFVNTSDQADIATAAGATAAPVIFCKAATGEADAYNVNFSGSLYLFGSDVLYADASSSVTDDDGYSFNFEDVTELPLTLTDLSAYGASGCYTTMYMPVKVAVTGATVYTVSGNVGNSLNVEELTDGIVPANTGVILEGTATTATATICANASTATSVLKGSVPAIVKPTGDDVYVLSVANSKLGFYKFEGAEMKGFRAYYEGTSPDPTRGFVLNFGETTGINAATRNADGNAYDLQGRRVQNAQKGIFIINGKKVVK